jgi:undecaprenyl-phosphate 4-deoxy-4-formamido-L-arabinose transferase
MKSKVPLRLSIVIPVFNSEKTIGALCRDLVGALSGRYRLEVILVNDFSRDGSAEVCKALHDEFRDTVTLISLSRNFGEHNAVMAGLNNASGEYCVIMDDDFQNPPGEVSKLVEECLKGYDVVYAQHDTKKDGLFRNVGSRFNDTVANIVLRKPRGLYLSSFKVINRFLLDEIIKFSGPDPYIDGIILRTTANIGKVEVEHGRRPYGRSNYSLGKLVALWRNSVVNFSLLPLRLVGLMGILMLAGWFVYGFYILSERVLNPDRSYEYAVLLSVRFLLSGIALLAISLVGEYVGRIFLFLNREPQYVVREIRRASGKEMRVLRMTDGKRR